LSIDRKGKLLQLNVQVDTAGAIGYYPNVDEIKRRTITYGFFAALPVGVNMAWVPLWITQKVLEK